MVSNGCLARPADAGESKEPTEPAAGRCRDWCRGIGQPLIECINRSGCARLADSGEELHEGRLHREAILLAGYATIAVAVKECHLFTGEQRDRIEQRPVLLSEQA